MLIPECSHHFITFGPGKEITALLLFSRYDALVLFGESDEDVAFGAHLIQRCEDAGLKVFVPQRDLVAGTVEHETSSKIISERCRKVIAVFSPSFLQSERNMFLTGFAQHVGIMDGRNDKIIPIILRPCDLPVQYQMYHKVVYDPRKSKFVNFWDKILRVTFELKDVPDSLKTYEFFLSNDNQTAAAIGQRQPQSGHLPLQLPPAVAPSTSTTQQLSDSNYDSLSIATDYYGTDSMVTSITELSVARLVDVDDGDNSSGIVLPNPPSEEPNSDSVRQKPKSKIKQLKDRFKRSSGKKSSETH